MSHHHLSFCYFCLFLLVPCFPAKAPRAHTNTDRFPTLIIAHRCWCLSIQTQPAFYICLRHHPVSWAIEWNLLHFFMVGLLQLKAKFKWWVRNWLFGELIDSFRTKFTGRLSPFRLTALSLFLYGCEAILLAGTVPGGTFLPCQEFGFTSPRKKRRY